MTIHEIKPKTENTMIGGAIEGPKKSEESIKIYPHIRLEHQFFPETKKWEVGKEYVVTLKIKMTGLSIAKYQNDSEFDIIGADMNDTEEKSDK